MSKFNFDRLWRQSSPSPPSPPVHPRPPRRCVDKDPQKQRESSGNVQQVPPSRVTSYVLMCAHCLYVCVWTILFAGIGKNRCVEDGDVLPEWNGRVESQRARCSDMSKNIELRITKPFFRTIIIYGTEDIENVTYRLQNIISLSLELQISSRCLHFIYLQILSSDFFLFHWSLTTHLILVIKDPEHNNLLVDLYLI